MEPPNPPPAKRPSSPTPTPSSATAGKRPLPASDIHFRLLIPTSSIGALIGTRGTIISKIRDETLTRIRIDDPLPGPDDRLPGSDDRVVSITPLESADVAGIQTALVRVLERVEEGKEAGGVCCCRLLVGGDRIGCVLGKGGMIVERIRGESGAMVRILGKEQLPKCAGAGDLMISITGNMSAVRKALLSVSGCLLDNVRTESSNFGSSKPFGSSLRGSATRPPMDQYAPRSYLPSYHVSDTYSRPYSLNPGIDVPASGHRNFLEEDVVFRMLCSNDRVHNIIGIGGVVHQALQSETGALIRITDPVSDSDERIIVISAWENSEQRSSRAQDAVLRVHSKLVVGVDKGSLVPARLLVPAHQIGCLLGKGGSIVAEMRRITGANIRIFSKEQVPECAQPHDEVVQVIGTVHSVQDALLHITSRIRETIFPQNPYTSAGMTRYLSTAPEVSPMLRSRNEPIVRPSHGFDTIERQPPLPHGVDRLGVDRTFSYGNETASLQSFDHSPSPRPRGSQIEKSRVLPAGPDLGVKSGLIASATGTPSSTTTSTEMVVPAQYVPFVHGENDKYLAIIKEKSGARVTINGPKHGEPVGRVIITGFREQIGDAQLLVHGFILKGKFPKNGPHVP